MSRDHASKGYKVVGGTDATAHTFYGFTVIAEAVISAVAAPAGPGPENTAYNGDESGLAAKTLPVGFYPIRGSSLTLSSGKVILWTE